MSKRKELIICIMLVGMLILTLTTNVFATNVQSLSELSNNTNTNENENFQTITENTSNNNVNTNANINTNTNVNTNTNTNNTTDSIPYTGVDYSLLVIIAICGASAVYAYKKIRDYNI